MAAIAERGRQFDEKKPIMQQQADASTTKAGAAVTAANRPRSGGSGGVDTTNIRTLQDFTARERTLRTQLSKAFGAEKEKLQGELDTLLTQRREFETRTPTPKAGDNSNVKAGDFSHLWSGKK
jgi:hypothetical protein